VKIGTTLYVTDRAAWRAWLQKYFATEKEVWLIFPNKASGKKRLSYNDAVEEALCFGWIDSIVKKFDAELSAQRFSPRRRGSAWSQPNRERLVWLMQRGKIHSSVRPVVQKVLAEKFVFPTDIIKEIQQNKLAWKHYQEFSPAYKRIRIAYIEGARSRPEEFAKRLRSFIAKTEQNKSLALAELRSIFSDMKQQVFVIHGGTSFDSYEEYLAFIKTRELTLEKLTAGEDWKAFLSRDLGDSFEVLTPRMPNGTNAKYTEWSLWLDRCIPFINDGVILVGQSLGGIFLAKYLAEHDFPRKIKATILVCAPFNAVSTVESLKDFALPASLERFVGQGGEIYIMHSTDDPVVPFGEMDKYQQALPAAQVMSFSDRGHFNQPAFPELVDLLRRL
jgi:predicted alpha/beta hydrolase family esterase/uncharacterized protein YdeI (YjbR/CyaY-like superfamily)